MTDPATPIGPMPPWVGKLPPGWRAEKLKFVARVRPSNVDKKSVESEKSVKLCNYTDVYKNEIIGPDLPFMDATATDEQVRAFSLRQGDVLITKDSEDWRDIAVPAYVPETLPGVVCGYHLAVIRPAPTRMDGQYLFRAFGASGVNDQFRYSAMGITRFGLSTFDIENAVFPIPPLDNQRRIAAYLDERTGAIDALVADKHRMVTLCAFSN